jgi:hypothetical protein
MSRLLFSRLRSAGAFERVFRERLSEPLHLQLLSLLGFFGSYQRKVYFDLAYRQYTAFSLLDAAKRAKHLGIKKISAVEFGVASGAGLINICENAKEITKEVGVEFEIYGFDTGAGLPPPRSYRDHPELWQAGDFPMDVQSLRARLPANAELIIGDIAKTVPEFLRRSRGFAPLGYVALDVDYYWSAVEALNIFSGPPQLYLPFVNLYLDDVHNPHHNPSCGELLACREFGQEMPLRPIYPYTALREKRLFKNASWISKIYAVHILDHEIREKGYQKETSVIFNPYL